MPFDVSQSTPLIVLIEIDVEWSRELEKEKLIRERASEEKDIRRGWN
jgi:hypothetical protein